MFHQHSYTEFAVLFFGTGSVLGIRVKRTKTGASVCAYAEHPHTEDDLPQVLKDTVKEIGVTRESILVVSGALPDGLFFRCTMGNLPVKYLRSALELELSRKLLSDHSGSFMQFCKTGHPDAENVPVNVYTFNSSARHRLETLIMQSVHKADLYCYPLIGLLPEDPAVYLPELEKDFYFEYEEWQPMDSLEPTWFEKWKTILSQTFKLPEGFSAEKYLPCLLTARFLLSDIFIRQFAGVDILPKKMKPGRYRMQLIIMSILTAMLSFSWLWQGWSILRIEQQRMKSLMSETASLQRRLTINRAKLKSLEKEKRELIRVVTLSGGETKLIEKLALLTSVLPSNVMIMSFRLSETGIDLLLRSEEQNFNLQDAVRPVKIWKVTSVRQFRRGNESTGTIMAKLIPAEESEK